MKLKLSILTLFLAMSAAFSVSAQPARPVVDTVMVLPFENTSGRADVNWVGESFAEALSDLLRIPGLNVISNEERKIIQQNLRISLSSLPSLAASLKMAQEGKATLLVTGKYSIVPGEGDTAMALTVTAKIVRVGEGRFLSEEIDGKKITRDIVITDALNNLQTIHGQVAYQVLYQRDKNLMYSQNNFVNEANKVPAVAFQAYVKGLVANESEAQSREGYFKNAVNIYSREKQGGVYNDAALELGHLYLEQRRFAEALTYFSMISRDAPNYAEAAFYSGLIYWRQANFEQALAVLRPLADDLKIPAVYNTLGSIALHASRVEKKNKVNATALLNEGIAYLQKAVQSSPDSADAAFNYGLALFTNGNYAESIPHFRANLKLRPRDGDCYFLLAKALEMVQDPTAAEVDDQSRQFLTAENRYAKLQTEWTRTKLTDLINVRVLLPPRKDFVSLVMVRRTLPPEQSMMNETETMLAKAREHYKANQDDEALEVLRRVLFSEPMSAESYYLTGMIFLRRGDLDQALGNLKTSLFWDNRYFDAYVPLVKIYIQRSDCLQAQNYFRLAKEIAPQREELASLQRQVERCSK